MIVAQLDIDPAKPSFGCERTRTPPAAAPPTFAVDILDHRLRLEA